MVNNSQIGFDTNKLHEILKEDNEQIVKTYFNKNQNIIIKDIVNINSLNTVNDNYVISFNSPFYNSFINNRNSFFYLLKNYNYKFEQLINYLIKTKKFIIFDKNFYNKLLKINICFPELNLTIYEDLFDYDLTSKYLLNLILEHGDTYFIKEFLKNIVTNQNLSLCKEFINRRPFFMKSKLDIEFCNEVFDILEYNSSYNYYTYTQNENFKKRDYNIFLIFELILPYIIYNIGKPIVGNIINKYMNSIVIKYNAVNFFSLLTKHKIPFNIDYIDNMDFPVIADCLKYGNKTTLEYLINNNVKIIKTYFFPENDLIECSFFNFNYKISEIFLNNITTKICSNPNLCITHFTDKETIKEYVKTIFSNYDKKKNSFNSYCIVNNKQRKIFKSSLKRQIDILYNFLDNDNNYKECNKNLKQIFLRELLTFSVGEIIKENLSLDFLKKYNLNLLCMDSILKYQNIFTNEKNLDFFLEKIDNNTNLHNFVINISSSFCRCKMDNLLNLFHKKGIIINNLNKLFKSEANRTIVSFLEKCKNCKNCIKKDNLEFIIEFYKKYFLKDNCFCSNRSIFLNYNIQYLKNFYINTNYKIEELYKQYFLNGFGFANLFEETEDEFYTYQDKLKYNDFVKGLDMEDIPLLKPLYAISIINYNIKKFIQKRRKHNIEKFKSCISKINNEFMFTPNDNTNKINKFIGIEFKKQINKLFFKNPVHIKPEHCVNNIHETHKYITEKADGITGRKSMKHISDLNFDFIVEYENMGNVNIVFNINNGDNVFDNMMYLRNLHPYTPRIDKFYFNQETLKSFIEIEKKAYNEYINNVSGKLWWPKFVWIIEKECLVDYLNCIKHLEPLDIFKTDGYILYSSDQTQDIIKIKPFDLLTIDLKYKNGSWYTKENTLFKENIISYGEKLIDSNIYRIYYDKETSKYYAREQRTDKKHANNNEIINYLVKCHKSQWTINNIINNLNLNNYYQLNTFNSGTYLKNIIRKYSFKEVNYIRGNVLDLGCGYKQKYINNNKIKSLLGLDVDVSVILNKSGNINNKLNYGLYDFSLKDYEQHNKFGGIYEYFENNENKNNKFDTIVMLNTIHNSFPNNYDNLKGNISKFAQKDTIIVVRYLDKDLLHSNFIEDYIDLNSFGYLKKNNDNVTIYYNWCHNKQKTEYLVGKSDLMKIFNTSEIIYEENKILNNDLTNIEKYFNSFKTIIFKY
jgi:hypothetical protein